MLQLPWMTNRAYAGVGSRATPPPVLVRMRDLAAELAGARFELRSGAADGADIAFEQGCDSVGGDKSIFLPWPGFQGRHPEANASTFLPAPRAFEIASTVHPAWSRLTRGPRALHARNSHQALGKSLDEPSLFTICWTSDGAETARDTTSKTGGTGTAIRLSSLHGIPVFNLAREDAEARLRVLLERIQHHADRLQPEAGVAAKTARPVLRFPA